MEKVKSPYFTLRSGGFKWLTPRQEVTSRSLRDPYYVSTVDNKNKPGRSYSASTGLCSQWVVWPPAKPPQTDLVCFSTLDSKGLDDE